MIAAGNLTVNFRLSSLIEKSNINIDGASLKNASVNFTKIQESDTSKDLNINVFIQRINEMLSSGKGNGQGAKVNIGEIVISQSNFIFNDTEKDSIKVGFDYNHFQLAVEDLEAENFKVIGDSTLMNVMTLQATDRKTDLTIKNLSTYFLVCQKSMEFINLELETHKSLVRDTIILKYQSLADLSDFNNKVTIKAKLHDTQIDPEDLALFNNGESPLPKTLFLDGNISGKVSRFTIQKMKAALGNTFISGKLSMDGLPAINETFIDLDVDEGTVIVNDLKFLFNNNIYQRIEPFDRFKMKGQFTGFINDFVADGEFKGKLGFIKSDINLKVNEQKVEESTFSGGLLMLDFDLGAYFKDTVNFQKVTLTGNIKGKGLTEETTDFLLNGQIKTLGIRNYNYTNITTNARFARQLFSGNISIQDPNVKFRGEGSLDLRPGKEIVKLVARLDTAYVHRLGFINEYFRVSSDININTKGLQLDAVLGDITLKHTDLKYQDRSLQLDSIHLISNKTESKRTFSVKSSIADLNVEGDFYYSSLLNDFQRLFHEFILNIRNDKEEIAKYYSIKNKSTQEYKAKFQLNLHNINPIFHLAGLNLSISEKVKVEGDFSNGFTSILNLYSSIDTIQYEDKVFYKTDIEFSGSKVRDSTHVLAMLALNSEKQKFAPKLKTKDLFAEAIWNSDHVDVTLEADQDGLDNYIRLSSEIDFLRDSTKIKILPSRLKILEKEWIVNQKNYTLVRGREWNIHHLEIHHNQESIFLEGQISKDPEELLNLTVHNFDLNILNAISSEKISGLVTGNVKARDLYANPYVQNDVSIKSLTVNDFLIGDVNGVNSWNRQDERFDIEFSIDRLGQRTMSIVGYYDPQDASPLNVKAELEKTNIKIAEPFLRGIFSQLDGMLSGSYTITGTFGKPLIKGEGNIESGKVMVDYLKTLYTFSGSLDFTPNQIIFKDIDLTDGFKNKASLDGFLIHKNFAKFRINLDATFRNFQLLNTTAKDNELFYGQAYGSGKLNMFGPLQNMKISATARTEKNTRIFIPISGTQTVEKKDFITFFNLKDSIVVTSQEKVLKKKFKSSETTGLTMDLNLDITPDAYAEIIFDIKAGDIIRGYGNGDIKLQLDTRGEFNMFGLYEFERGNYNFTLYDVINKEFSINKGSRISWFGDPYSGVLNLSANYRQLASLVPILSDQPENVLKAPQIKRKYPVEVQLKLDGPMLSPQISFDITSKDLPDNLVVDGTPVRLNFYFNAFKAKLDEQELKKQVFSLIVLRRFSPLDAFTTSGALSNSVSEFLSNQLSYWLTQVDQNLEVDLDLGKMDQEAFNTFQLRLSYSFLNGRLRVTRDGTFSNQYNRSDVANMLGDWTVDYLLTADGKFKVKMYNRTNLNQLNNSLGAQAAITTGVSLLHTQNFNRWKDLISSARDKRRKELERQQNNKEAVEEKDGSY